MTLKEIYNKKKTVLSFEVFPPKQEYNFSKLFDTIKDLKSENPDFVSVTYGAGGSSRDKTVEIASTIKNEIGIEAIAHFTCVNSTKDEIIHVLDKLRKNNIKNILALRGDPPAGQTNFTKEVGGFGYASELIEFIKKHSDWSIAVAGYPEGHLEAENLEKDIDFLKLKVDKGADVIISQIFFENEFFYKFRDIAVKKGINIPIVPGIFPILNFSAIKKMTSLCGATIPNELHSKLERVQDNTEDTEKVGIEYAINQSKDLLRNGIPGLHFYSMNKSEQIKKIIAEINSAF